jgi:hypothetical protein
VVWRGRHSRRGKSGARDFQHLGREQRGKQRVCGGSGSRRGGTSGLALPRFLWPGRLEHTILPYLVSKCGERPRTRAQMAAPAPLQARDRCLPSLPGTSARAGGLGTEARSRAAAARSDTHSRRGRRPPSHVLSSAAPARPHVDVPALHPHSESATRPHSPQGLATLTPAAAGVRIAPRGVTAREGVIAPSVPRACLDHIDDARAAQRKALSACRPGADRGARTSPLRCARSTLDRTGCRPRCRSGVFRGRSLAR